MLRKNWMSKSSFFFSLEQKFKVVESNEILKISCPLFVPGFVYISWISPFCFKYWCDQTSDIIWYSIYKGKIKTLNKEFSIERTFSLNFSISLLSTKCRPDRGMDHHFLEKTSLEIHLTLYCRVSESRIPSPRNGHQRHTEEMKSRYNRGGECLKVFSRF